MRHQLIITLTQPLRARRATPKARSGMHTSAGLIQTTLRCSLVAAKRAEFVDHGLLPVAVGAGPWAHSTALRGGRIGPWRQLARCIRVAVPCWSPHTRSRDNADSLTPSSRLKMRVSPVRRWPGPPASDAAPSGCPAQRRVRPPHLDLSDTVRAGHASGVGRKHLVQLAVLDQLHLRLRGVLGLLVAVVDEAMAAGLPIVTTAVGGIPEFLTVEEAILTPSGDARALAEGLAQLFERPEEARARAERARQVLEKEFDVGGWVERYSHVYETVTGSP